MEGPTLRRIEEKTRDRLPRDLSSLSKQRLAREIVGLLAPYDLPAVQLVLGQILGAVRDCQNEGMGWQRRGTTGFLRWLFKKRRRAIDGNPFDVAELDKITPGEDHAFAAIDPKGEKVWVSEPYQLPDTKILTAFCQEHGLKCHITGRASWYPGSCLRVEYRRAKENADS